VLTAAIVAPRPAQSAGSAPVTVVNTPLPPARRQAFRVCSLTHVTFGEGNDAQIEFQVGKLQCVKREPVVVAREIPRLKQRGHRHGDTQSSAGLKRVREQLRAHVVQACAGFARIEDGTRALEIGSRSVPLVELDRVCQPFGAAAKPGIPSVS
jgi:hypothetical protein